MRFLFLFTFLAIASCQAHEVKLKGSQASAMDEFVESITNDPTVPEKVKEAAKQTAKEIRKEEEKSDRVLERTQIELLETKQDAEKWNLLVYSASAILLTIAALFLFKYFVMPRLS